MAGYNVSLQGSITGFTKVSSAIKQYNALGAVSLKEQQAFATAVSATNSKLGTYLIGLNGSTAGLRGYGVSLVASTAKTIGLTVATTALNAAMTMGISVIVTGLISAFTAWINKSEEITEKAQEATDKINSISESLKTNTETVENAKRRYAELAQEVENLGKITQSQGTLSNEEYEEFLDLSNQLAGIFPSLTKNYDENGNAILDLSGDVNTIVSSLDDLIQKEKELANQKIMEEFPDVFKGYAQDVSDAEAKVKSAQTEFDKINNAYQQLSNGSTAQSFDLQGNGWFTNENGEKVTLSMGEYIANLEALGLKYEKTQLKVKNQFGGDTIAGYLVEATGDIDTAFTSKLETARENLQYAQQQLEGEKSSIDSYLNTWLQTEFSYNQIEDSGLQTAIQDMLFNFDFSSLPETVDKNDWNAVSEYLRRNILFAINNVQDNPEISSAISEVFTNAELTPDEKANYLQQIQDFFGEDSAIVISLKPQIEETNTLQKQLNASVDKFKSKPIDITPYQEALDDEYQKIQDWGLEDYADKIKNGTIQSVFGNIDMDKRTIITWSDELKQTYADALASWDYDPEVGSIDTVFGGSNRFGEELNGVGWEVAFTPILPDGTFLNQDTVYDYINTILEEAYADDGKVTEDELVKIDAQGRQIGNTFVQGIFAGIDDSQNYDNNGNWAETVGRLMHFSGDFGAVQIAKDAITKAKKQESDFDWDSWFKENSINTQEEIDRWNKIAESAANAADARKKYTEGEQGNKTDILSFTDLLNSADYKDIKEKLLDIAKSGEITEETLSSTEEYNKLLEETGTSADSAKNQILDMLSAQEKLSAATQGLNKLKSAYEEFKNKDIGFVTAETLESLPDVFKSLPEFDLFSKIVGDPQSGAKKIQQAFNDICKAYLLSQDTLSGLVGASQSEINSYVANLKQMGVTNAQEFVNQTVEALNSENKLINEAETEFYNMYLNYIEGKSELDTDYLKDTASKNGKLASALGSAYQQDYENWCDLLSQKAEAYNEFVEAVGGSYDESLSITGNMLNNGKTNITTRDIVNAYTAQAEYLRAQKEADAKKQELKLDINPIKTNFGTHYSPSSTNSNKGGSSSDSKDTKQTIDWISRLLDVLQKKIDALKAAFDNALTLKDKKNNLAEQIKLIKNLFTATTTAAERYKKAADKVGLSKELKAKVQNGSYDITEYDSKTAEKIQKYQEYLDQYNELKKQEEELTAKIRGLKSDDYQLSIDNAESNIAKLDAKIDNTSSYKERIKYLKEERKYIRESYYNQIKQAELDGELAKADELRAKRKKELTDNSIAQFQQEADNAQSRLDKSQAYAALDEGNYKAQNKHLEAQKKYTKDYYKAQIQIAKKNGDLIEADRLRAEKQKELNDLSKQEFDNISDTYNKKLQLLDAKAQSINNQIGIIEAKGYVVSADYYNSLTTNTKKNLSELTDELVALRQKRDEMLKDGTLEKGSDDWYEIQNAIWSVKNAQDDATKSIIEYQKQIRQLKWDAFDRQEDFISKIQDESDFLIDLMSNEKLFADDGNWTEYANAIAGLRAMNYNAYMAQADDYEKEIQAIQQEINNDPYNIDLIQRKQELISTQRELIKSAEQEKESIKSLVSDGYDKWLDALQKSIDLRKKELDSVSDLYTYQKNIAKLAKETANYEKQWLALQGDDSEENKATLQKVTVALQDSRDALQESEYEQWKRDQESMLDALADDAQEWVNQRLDNIDGLISDVITATNTNSDSIRNTLDKVASEVGITLSSDMSKIWDATDGISSVVSDYGDKLSGGITTVGNTLTSIKDYVAKISNASDKPSDTSTDYDFNPVQYSQKEQVSDFINRHKQEATRERDYYKALNQYIYDATGGYVLSKTDEAALANLLNVNVYSDLTGDAGRVDLERILAALKLTGFSEGGTIGKAIRQSGESGFILARTGEEVLSLEKIDKLKETLKLVNPTPNIKPFEPFNIPVRTQNIGNNIDSVQMEINLPNVTNYEEFKSNLIKDRQFEKVIQTMTFGNALGGNTLNKYRIR